MSTLNELARKWPRILILYPAYSKISQLIESTFPLVRKVREDPIAYPYSYISPHTIPTRATDDNYQIIEVLTHLDGQHVEIMVILFRKSPYSWFTLRNELTGHILAQLPDSPVPDKIKCVMLANKNIVTQSEKADSTSN